MAHGFKKLPVRSCGVVSMVTLVDSRNAAILLFLFTKYFPNICFIVI